MTDDKKLELLDDWEQKGWVTVGNSNSAVDTLKNALEVIERCQRIRANLKDKSCKLEVTCPY